MNRQTWVEVLLFVLLVAIGAQVRVLFQDLPNFAPVAAIALFAGYVFRSRWWAVSVPLLIMTISDLQIGGYGWQMMLLVYLSLAAPVFLRDVLRKCLALEGGSVRAAALRVTGLVSCSLGAALFFFVVTNFGCWFWYGTYEKSLAGLGRCYVQALPFFRYTLLGDLFFSVVLFGGWAAAVEMRWAAARRREIAVTTTP